MWTRKGAIVLVGCFAAGAVGLALSNGFLVQIFLVTLPALVLAQVATPRPRLHVERRVSHERLEEGDAVEVAVLVRNDGTSTLFMEISDELHPLFKVKTGSSTRRCVLKPGENATVEFAAEAPVKGRYVLRDVRVRVEDAFGLVYHAGTFERRVALTVLPASERLKKVPGRTRFPRVFLGQQLVRAPGQGMEFFGLREYMPGDPLKEVNWKASARSKNLVVNQRERETLADVTMFVDAREISGYGRDDDNVHLWTARAAASLTTFFLHRRDRVRLVTYGDRVSILEPDSGERHYSRIVEALTDLAPRGTSPFSQAVHDVFPRLHRKSPVVVLSGCLEDRTLVEGCALLKAHEMDVLVVGIVPREIADDVESRTLVDLERRVTLMDLREAGARVIEWDGQGPLTQRLMEVSLS